MRFTGSDSDINIFTDHQEFREWQWAPVDTLVDRIVPFKKELYQQVIDRFATIIEREFG
jgi:putative (di)nucleoside polyphosphate hydrolase